MLVYSCAKMFLKQLLLYFTIFQAIFLTKTDDSQDESKFCETDLQRKGQIAVLIEQNHQLLEEQKKQGQRLESLEKSLKSIVEIYSNKVTEFENSTISLPKNCRDVQNEGSTKSGIYVIQPDPTKESFKVWCDMETKGGGWIYVINRFDYTQNFNLSWSDYKKGFGNLSHEFWLGLENLYILSGLKRTQILTGQSSQNCLCNNSRELLIELVDWNMTKAYAYYKQFSIGSEDEGYALRVVEGYDGDAGDCFSRHLGLKFTTPDRDQDSHPTANCAYAFGGGFWYGYCKTCCLFTGIFEGHRITYDTFRAKELKEIKMMIR